MHMEGSWAHVGRALSRQVLAPPRGPCSLAQRLLGNDDEQRCEGSASETQDRPVAHTLASHMPWLLLPWLEVHQAPRHAQFLQALAEAIEARRSV